MASAQKHRERSRKAHYKIRMNKGWWYRLTGRNAYYAAAMKKSSEPKED